MSSSSESEGEIREAKATTAQHHDHHNNINTNARTPPASPSPIWTPDGTYDRDYPPRGEKRHHDEYLDPSRSHSDAHDEYGYTSRSHYKREDRNGSHHSYYSRNEYKRDERRRNDDRRNTHSSSRQGSRHHGDRGHNNHRAHGPSRGGGYYDLDDPGNATNFVPAEDDDRQYRSRSRSPKRYRRGDYRDHSERDIPRGSRILHEQRPWDARRDPTIKQEEKEKLVSDRGDIPNRSRLSESHAERSSSNPYQVLQPQVSSNRNNKQRIDLTPKGTLPAETVSGGTNESVAGAIADSELVEDEASIERIRKERQKRREEIKAMHKSKAATVNQDAQVNLDSALDVSQPGVVATQAAALQPSNSHFTASIPAHDGPFGQLATPTAGAVDMNVQGEDHAQNLANIQPQSTRSGSPAELGVGDDAELARDPAKTGSHNRDQPSAADYDPTADMQADKLRDMEHHENFVAAKVDKEKNADASQVSTTRGSLDLTSSSKSHKSAAEYDMFAESDDDDDMFAADDSDRVQQGPARAAQELNAGMLDDWDTPDGYYKIWLGELLDRRYSVKGRLGTGMFSGVVRAHDERTRKLVAIKIIRNNESMRKAAATEVDVLNRLKEKDEGDYQHIVRLDRSFEHKGHLCMVFENLDTDLRSFLKKVGRNTGLTLPIVRRCARQMFAALKLLQDANLVHADLKPDNILLSSDRNRLKICDLGSAINLSDVDANEPRPYLASRFYRAPELILGLKYDFAIDMWSIGCTLFEIFTGSILFNGPHNNAMLYSMMECRGPLPKRLLKRANDIRVNLNGRIDFPFNDEVDKFMVIKQDKTSGRELVEWTPLTKITKPGSDLRSRLYDGIDEKSLSSNDRKEYHSFYDLLDKCLHFYPDRRIKPEDAMKHPFFR